MKKAIQQRAATWLRRWFVISVAMTAFAFGVAVGTFRIFPYDLLQSTAAGIRDWAQYPRHNARLLPEKFLWPAPAGGAEPVAKISPLAWDGVTFLTGFFDESLGMRLVDMDGRILHEWRVSFNRIWPNPSHIDTKPHDWDTQIHGAILYPNGDVVFNFQYMGLVKIDKCSNTKWRLPYQTHHSISEADDGNLWVPSRRLRDEPVEGLPNVPAPFYEPTVLEVSPDGELLREISILARVFEADYQGILFASGTHVPRPAMPLSRDFAHLNDVEVLGAQMARAFPQFDEGDLLVSLRNLDLVLVMSPDEAKVKWAMTGPFLRQHDPDFVANGRISVFDNQRDNQNGAVFGGSRILEINPLTRETHILYGGIRHEHLYTETMGDHQRLDNGNVLITESEPGRVLEVTADHEIVWSYVNRWNDEFRALIGRATRYPKDYASSIRAATCS